MYFFRIILIAFFCCFSFHLFSQQIYVEVSGKNENETKVIDSLSYKREHENFLLAKQEVEKLQNVIWKHGYIESELLSFNKKNDTTFLAIIHLNKKYRDVTIFYSKNDLMDFNLAHITNQYTNTHFTIPFIEVENALEQINNYRIQNGYPFNEIRLDNILTNKNLIEATLFSSRKEKKRLVNKIIVKGYAKFPKAYLKHFLKLKTNTSFNLNEIKNKTNSLNQIRFASEIKDPEVLFTKDSTTLYLYLKKEKSNNFDGFLGFGTNENTNKLQFNGYLNLNLNNNLNYDESFNLVYRSDENDQKTFDVKITLPYLFNTPLGTESGLQIFKSDSTFRTVNQYLKVFYQLSSQSNFSFAIKGSQSNPLQKNTFNATIQNYTKTTYSIGYQYKNFYNSALFPYKELMELELGYGSRKLQSKTENQIPAKAIAQKIFILNNKNSIFTQLQSEGLLSSSYVENELVRFGGINSIRGFEENSLQSSFYALLNTEYRYLLTNAVYTHTIIDFAYLENKLQKENLYGFGLGFGLLTKAGILKFNYANGKTKNQKFKFSNSKIHLSLTAVF